MNALVKRATGAGTKGERSKMIAEAQSARGEVPKASTLKGASKQDLLKTYKSQPIDIKRATNWLAELYRHTESFRRARFEDCCQMNDPANKGLPIRKRMVATAIRIRTRQRS